MKFWATLLLVGMTAITAYYFGQRNRSSINQVAPPVNSVSGPAAIPSSDSALATLQPPRSLKPFDPFGQIKASLNSRLRRWKESLLDNPDDEEEHDQLLQELFALVTDESVAAVIQSLSAEEMNTPFGLGVLHHWMKVAPVAAADWLASRPDATPEQIFLIANDWIGNRDGFQQYLNQQGDTAWKQALLGAASSALSTTDHRAATALAEKMHPGETQTNLLRAVACSWVDIDPVAALDWVASVKDSALREQLSASAFQSYALRDPSNAATWLVSDVKSDDVAKEAAFNILETWVTKDPQAAAAWASRFPEGESKAAAVKIVSRYWQQIDPAAANAWIKNLPK